MLCHCLGEVLPGTLLCPYTAPSVSLCPLSLYFIYSIFLSYTLYIYLVFYFIYILKILLICFQRERKEGRKGEKHQCVVASCATPTGVPACNPGMCPDRESNQRPFGYQVGAQPTEPHQAGLFSILIFVSPLKCQLCENRNFVFTTVLEQWLALNQ